MRIHGELEIWKGGVVVNFKSLGQADPGEEDLIAKYIAAKRKRAQKCGTRFYLSPCVVNSAICCLGNGSGVAGLFFTSNISY